VRFFFAAAPLAAFFAILSPSNGDAAGCRPNPLGA